jgi:hypothetical protein
MPGHAEAGDIMTDPGYTAAAVEAVSAAVDAEHDFAGWLARVLAAAAARKGSTGALTAGRPGSWEASFVDRLVKGTVGWDDEYLSDYGERSND